MMKAIQDERKQHQPLLGRLQEKKSCLRFFCGERREGGGGGECEKVSEFIATHPSETLKSYERSTSYNNKK